MFLRLGMSLLLTLSCFVVKAQGDTILLKSVTVYGLPEEKYLSGSRIIRLDSTLNEEYSSRHLGEVLSFQFPIYFRNYGNGMLSGISMRGTSPQHVAVRWNGININSFSVGQADFSILPAVAFDDIKVHAGAGSAQFGSGAFGGSILLSSFNDKSRSASLSQEVGSFGRYFSSLKGSFQTGNLSYSTSFYNLQNDNDFPVAGLSDRQQNASFFQRGFVQDVQYDFSASKKISLHYWYHDADRELQPTIGTSNSSDEQADRNHRLSISYEQNNDYGLLTVGGGIVNDRIIYNGTNSEVLRFIASASHQYTFGKQWHALVSTEWNHIIGKINAYGPNEPVEDRVDVSASVRRSAKKLTGSFSVRQPFITGIKSPILPYLGVDIMLFENRVQRLVVNANGSKNFRAPTLNDRYWGDVGNKDLLPETSYATELGFGWMYKKFKINTTAFYQRITEWIQWVPEANGVYRPHNVKEVEVKGIDVSAEASLSSGKFSVSGKVAYQFVQSITLQAHDSDISAVGNQLIYTPEHTGSSTLGLTYGTWRASFCLQYAGERFTEASNSPIYALAPYSLLDLSLGKSWKHKGHSFDFSFMARNVLDKNYQMYSGRAMPGRNFNFKITYQLTHTPK